MLSKARLSKVERQKKQIKLVFTLPMESSDIDLETIDGMPGYLCFQAKPITAALEKQLENKKLGLELDGKTWSQKLRGTILTLWHYSGNSRMSEDFYSDTMYKIINHYEGAIQKLKEEEK